MTYKGRVKKKLKVPGGYILSVNLYDDDGELVMEELPEIKLEEGEDYTENCWWEVPDEEEDVEVCRADDEWKIVEK